MTRPCPVLFGRRFTPDPVHFDFQQGRCDCDLGESLCPALQSSVLMITQESMCVCVCYHLCASD